MTKLLIHREIINGILSDFASNYESMKRTLLVNDFLEGKEKYGVYYTYMTYLGSN